MTAEELKKQGGLYFENIQEGWNTCDWEQMYLSPKMARSFLLELREKNGPENSFADCYYPYLEEESREKVRQALTSEEAAYLDGLPAAKENLIFPLDDMMLAIGTKLNDRELLFFTFYFTGDPLTVWGNYKQEYICFRPKKSEEIS